MGGAATPIAAVVVPGVGSTRSALKRREKAAEEAQIAADLSATDSEEENQLDVSLDAMSKKTMQALEAARQRKAAMAEAAAASSSSAKAETAMARRNAVEEIDDSSDDDDSDVEALGDDDAKPLKVTVKLGGASALQAPLRLTLHKGKALGGVLLDKVREHFQNERLVCKFDGIPIDPADTPEDIQLESGGIIEAAEPAAPKAAENAVRLKVRHQKIEQEFKIPKVRVRWCCCLLLGCGCRTWLGPSHSDACPAACLSAEQGLQEAAKGRRQMV